MIYTLMNCQLLLDSFKVDTLLFFTVQSSALDKKANYLNPFLVMKMLTYCVYCEL